MFFITFLSSYILIAGQSNARIYPSNTAVIAGKQFNLTCDHSVKIIPSWRFLRLREYSDQEIYNGTHFPAQFRDFQFHSTADGLSILSKPYSGKADAGTYKCIQKHGSDYFVSSAQVIVLAADPLCSPVETNVVEGRYLELNCSVEYVGSIAPTIKYDMDDGIDSHFVPNISPISNSSHVISVLKMNATRSENNATYICTIYFNQTIMFHENQTDVRKAINAPTYEDQCRHRINVLFEPEAADITPRKDIYTLGDVLLCNAKGNPPPTYEWTDLRSNRVISKESTLPVDSHAMENHAYKCTATNYAIGKEKSISTSVTILAIIPSSQIDSSTVQRVTIAAGVICGILTLIIFTIVIKRFNVLGCLSSCMLREGDYGPDIVQNADENANERYALEENGYAQPEDLGLGTPPVFQHRGFATEAKDEGFFLNHNGGEVVPVYAEVQKKSQAVAAGLEIPVYGKVQKKDEVKTVYREHTSSASKPDDREVCLELDMGSNYPSTSKKQFIGADGTQYMEMSEVMNPSSPTLPPLFERSQYAEIDHTQ